MNKMAEGVLAQVTRQFFGGKPREGAGDIAVLPAIDDATAALIAEQADGIGNDNKMEPVSRGIAWKAFAERVPNALGEGAMKIDDKGLYAAAVNHPAYYLHQANKRLFATRSVAIANRINGIRHAIIFGQGPGEVFGEQEALLLEQMSALEEVTTIEFSPTYNHEASAIIEALSQRVGRPIRHNPITQSFEKAALTHPELLSPDKKLIVNSGSTIMNLPTDSPDAFPRRALQERLRIMRDMAGDEGYVLVTYDSYREDKVPAKLAAYQTDEARELFANVIDVIGEENPDLEGINRSNFEYVVRWNPNTYNAEQLFRVTQPFHLEIRYKGEHASTGNFRELQEVGTEFQNINSLMPPIEEVEAAGEEIGMLTAMTMEDEADGEAPTGFTMQLLRNKPRSPAGGPG